ncbi:SGNH/GDSL hydrolase family protein [Akkermansiaceae bacterium]|nr:SGNH/GDSL hydrolase family protein [Akkermansiaceae bacterium]
MNRSIVTAFAAACLGLSNAPAAPDAATAPADDPKLPRVLVIGDSISMNYHEAAKEALKGIANYHRIEGNSFTSVHGVENAELWLGNYKAKGGHWDIIQFNHGLHDLKQAYDKASDSFGDYAVSKELYKESLEKEIAILRKTGAKLIWCSTTPVQTDMKGRYARRKGAAKEFNEAALEVMKRHPDILINDLHSLVSEAFVFGDWWKTTDVHFYKPEEQQALGKAVAAAVKKALSEKSPEE